MKKIYTIITLFFLVSCTFIAQSQIVYKNASSFPFYLPSRVYDVYMVHEAYPQASDYIIVMDTVTKSNDYRIRIIPQYSLNQVLVSVNAGDTSVKALNLGDVIDGTQNIWTSNNKYWINLYNSATNKGNWNNVTNKYIGLKMYKNGDEFFGWVQMTITPGTSQPTVTLYDHAYQKTPGKGLTAGQTVGVNHIIRNNDNYILSNRRLNILADRAEKILITDMSGRQMLNMDVKSNKSIDLSAFANGIYMIRIATDNGILTDKILLN